MPPLRRRQRRRKEDRKKTVRELALSHSRTGARASLLPLSHGLAPVPKPRPGSGFAGSTNSRRRMGSRQSHRRRRPALHGSRPTSARPPSASRSICTSTPSRNGGLRRSPRCAHAASGPSSGSSKTRPSALRVARWLSALGQVPARGPMGSGQPSRRPLERRMRRSTPARGWPPDRSRCGIACSSRCATG